MSLPIRNQVKFVIAVVARLRVGCSNVKTVSVKSIPIGGDVTDNLMDSDNVDFHWNPIKYVNSAVRTYNFMLNYGQNLEPSFVKANPAICELSFT
jgi:hypothetical protein